MRTNTKRLFSLALTTALVAGAFVMPSAEAAKKKKFKCAPATATAPTAGHSSNAADAATAEVVNLTAANTEEAPLTIEVEHGAALHEPAQGTPIQEDTQYLAFQVVSKVPETGVHIRAEWPSTESDFDVYLYDATGAEVANSGAFNPAPVPLLLDAGGNGGQGFETIPGYPAAPCSPYTLESKAFLTPGDTVTYKIWLGEVTDTWNPPAP